MNCQEVQAQLSEYVDLSIGAARLGLVEEHLAVCPPCREEAEFLGESVREVVNLPWVDTPLGFTQRVMSHVREAETEPTFWRRFLLPLTSKMPAQAIPLIIVGVLGIYLLQKEQPHEQLRSGPETTTADAMKQDSAAATADEPSTPESSAVVPFENSLTRETQILSSRQGLQSRLPEETRERVESPAAPPMSSVPAPSFSLPPSTEAPVRATPIVSGTPVATATTQPSSGAATLSTQSDSDIAAFRATPPAIELFADLELVVRRHSTPPAAAAEATQSTVERSAAPRPIERLMAAIPDRTRPQTIWINVPQNQYEQFKKELHTLGIIESETRVPMLRDPMATHDGQIRVKLTALPAGETATSNPAVGR